MRVFFMFLGAFLSLRVDGMDSRFFESSEQLNNQVVDLQQQVQRKDQLIKEISSERNRFMELLIRVEQIEFIGSPFMIDEELLQGFHANNLAKLLERSRLLEEDALSDFKKKFNTCIESLYKKHPEWFGKDASNDSHIILQAKPNTNGDKVEDYQMD